MLRTPRICSQVLTHKHKLILVYVLERSYPAQESATRNREMAELFSTLSDSATGTSLSVFPRKNETLLLPAETDSALLKT